MNKYIQKIAHRILAPEINALTTALEEANQESSSLKHVRDALQGQITKLERKVRRIDRPENVLLAYYHIDNVDARGMPPSYLRPDDKKEYLQRISELESVYRNKTFRELLAWSLNFHANLSVAGELDNGMGDQIKVSSEAARHMIAGIRAIWDLLVAAHTKDQQITNAKSQGGYDILSQSTEEEDN